MQESPGTAVVKAVLICDLVDSTALLERLGDAPAASVFGRHDELVRVLVAAHDGREVDKSDGFLLLFDRPVNAVELALAYHAGLARLSEELHVPLSARVFNDEPKVVYSEELAPGQAVIISNIDREPKVIGADTR